MVAPPGSSAAELAHGFGALGLAFLAVGSGAGALLRALRSE
ncbi:hypothetical protein [Halosimplex litoreum]|nr:hypothetical protein [Halosimplex litoreum]